MSYCTVNGVGVTRGELVLPRVGVWHAELELEDDTVQDGNVSISWWGQQLNLKGTVRYGGAEDGVSHLSIVGGSGGLTTAVQPKAYRNVPRRTVVQDLLGLAGESISPRADIAWLSTMLPFWTLMKSTVGRSVALLVELQEGISWRVLADGRFWFGPESWGVVNANFEVLARDPRNYRLEVSCDTPALQPGCTFQSQRISTATYRVEPSDLRVLLDFEAPNQ